MKLKVLKMDLNLKNKVALITGLNNFALYQNQKIADLTVYFKSVKVINFYFIKLNVF